MVRAVFWLGPGVFGGDFRTLGRDLRAFGVRAFVFEGD